MFRFVLIVDRDMANRLALPNQDFVEVEKQSATVEFEVYVSAVRDDVAKPVLKRFAVERESNLPLLSFGDSFDRPGRFFQNHFPQG